MAIQVVVVGAGLAGLTAAQRLLTQRLGIRVTVLEASDRPGGQLHSHTTPDGRIVELGAEHLPLNDPALTTLIQDAGLTPQTPSTDPVLLQSSSGRLRPMPSGLSIGGPLRIAPLLGSGLLSPLGAARAAAERVIRHRRFPDDISLGGFAQLRFGAEVVTRIVDPLAGNQYAANVYALGMIDNAPEFDEVRTSGRSILRSAASPEAERATGPRPWPGAIGSLVEGNQALARALTATPGLRLLTHSAVTGITREGGRWLVHTQMGLHPADAVILATPGSVTDELAGELSGALRDALRWTRTASTSTLVAGIDPAVAQQSPVLREAGAVLLPRSSERLLHAVSNLSRRWPELRSGPDHLIRLDAGRSTTIEAVEQDDAALTTQLFTELGQLLGLTVQPRWTALARQRQNRPQLGTAHGQRIAEARVELARTQPGLEVAGGFIDGANLGVVVRSGQSAAQRVLGLLA